jgi:hypothetical protein
MSTTGRLLRETADDYLKAAGIGVRPPVHGDGGKSAKPDKEVTTGSDEAICATMQPTLTQGSTRCTRQICFSVFQDRHQGGAQQFLRNRLTLRSKSKESVDRPRPQVES